MLHDNFVDIVFNSLVPYQCWKEKHVCHKCICSCEQCAMPPKDGSSSTVLPPLCRLLLMGPSPTIESRNKVTKVSFLSDSVFILIFSRTDIKKIDASMKSTSDEPEPVHLVKLDRKQPFRIEHLGQQGLANCCILLEWPHKILIASFWVIGAVT
jgi:hypothetical protein